MKNRRIAAGLTAMLMGVIAIILALGQIHTADASAPGAQVSNGKAFWGFTASQIPFGRGDSRGSLNQDGGLTWDNTAKTLTASHVDNSPIGSATPSTGAFTTLASNGNFAVNTNKFNVAAASGNTTIAGTLGVTGNVTINGGTVNGTVIGGTTPANGTFAALVATSLSGPLTGNVDGVLGGNTPAAANVTTLSASGTANLNGGIAYGVTVTPGDYTATATGHHYLFSNTSAAHILHLPSASVLAQGQEYVAADVYGQAGINNITIAPAGSDTISGLSAVTVNNGHLTIVRTGPTSWATYK